MITGKLTPFLRHSRYWTFVCAMLLVTGYLIVPIKPQPSFKAINLPYIDSTNLPSRLAQAEVNYGKVLAAREELIKKYGPYPSDIQMFPASRDPWPPYTVWDFFPAAFHCPHEVRRIGALGDGGKWVCGLSRVQEKPDCIVYSVGINHESSYEAEILTNTKNCKIWGYDFSVDGFGKQIPWLKRWRTTFRPYGLAGTDRSATEKNPAMYTLNTLMRMNGHTHIDILKIDIESWEFETLTSLIQPYVDSDEPLPFGQLQLEIHVWGKNFEEFLKWWKMLENAGLRPFWTEPNLVYVNYNKGAGADLAEYSFINIKGDNIFIQNPHSRDPRIST